MGLGLGAALGDLHSPWVKRKGKREKNQGKGRRTCCKVRDAWGKPRRCGDSRQGDFG